MKTNVSEYNNASIVITLSKLHRMKKYIFSKITFGYFKTVLYIRQARVKQTLTLTKGTRH